MSSEELTAKNLEYARVAVLQGAKELEQELQVLGGNRGVSAELHSLRKRRDALDVGARRDAVPSLHHRPLPP